jgi:cyclopropane fatty-acyl-phospholipid synthase-like methyltransferase
MKIDLAQAQAEYAQLKTQLSALGWISQGYVQDRGPGAGGPCYQWTRKVKGKTVSVALSAEQFAALQQAIENWRSAQEILHRMQTLSREVIFGTIPNPPRRKRLGKKVLGLI